MAAHIADIEQSAWVFDRPSERSTRGRRIVLWPPQVSTRDYEDRGAQSIHRSTQRLAYGRCLWEIDMDCVHEHAITEAGQLVKHTKASKKSGYAWRCSRW
jgi:hypothetical protein